VKRINLKLSVESIDQCLAELKKAEQDLDDKALEFCKKLAEIGCNSARVSFASAAYDGVNDVSVATIPTANGYKVVASGQAVCFIEFGSGVHYQGSSPYPDTPPKELAGIGSFGKGNGSKDYWFFTAKAGTSLTAGGAYATKGKHPNSVITNGNPANACMYNSKKDMQARITAAVKEVFGK